jgi:hypothetical protein
VQARRPAATPLRRALARVRARPGREEWPKWPPNRRPEDGLVRESWVRPR